MAALAACFAAAAPGSASAYSYGELTSGPLSVQFTGKPFALDFDQRGGPAPKSIAKPAGGSAGAISFETGSGWHYATEVIKAAGSHNDISAELATDDPDGRTIDLRLAADDKGVIALDAKVSKPAGVTAVGAGFDAPKSERYYGLGERSNAVQQRGNDVKDYVSDGPFPPASHGVVSATIPPQGWDPRPDATYYPVPWLLSSNGWGALLDNDETSYFHLGTDPAKAWSVEADDTARLRMRFFAGPTPAKTLARFTEVTGRQPKPTAPWQFGPWFQTGQPNTVPLADESSWLQTLQEADAPVSVAETQLRYLPCGLDRGNEDYERKRINYFHRHGLAILTYVNPMVCQIYQPLFDKAEAAGALQRTADGQTATFKSFVGGVGSAGFSIEPVAEFDFTSSAGSKYYRSVLERMVKSGHDGWMEDFGEYTPPDTKPRDGSSGAGMHNRYPTTYHCAVAKMLEDGLSDHPIVRFQRSGWTGAARCSSDVWGGDPSTDWGFDGLSSAVKQALSMGLSGVSRWGSDIGGYDTLPGDQQLSPELLRRWIQFGSVSALMRTKKSGLAIPSYERPQIWDSDIIGTWRRYAKLHTQLYPYIRAADAEYRRTGMPIMRALLLTDPTDSKAQKAEDEFGFGPDLLAAPIVTPGATGRSVYLPKGRWIDWLSSVSYRRDDGSFHVKGADTLHGGQTITSYAGKQLPLYIRAGAVLPMLSPDVSTLSDYGKGKNKDIVRLADRRDRLRLLAFPSGNSTAHAYDDDTIDSHASTDGWTLDLGLSRRTHIHLEASTADLGFRPCRVRIGDRTVSRDDWQFAADRKVFKADFATRKGTLRVLPGGC